MQLSPVGLHAVAFYATHHTWVEYYSSHEALPPKFRQASP
jgi:hypothetical protein